MTPQEKKREYNQAYYAKRRAEILAQKKEYYEQHRERIIQYVKDNYDPEKKRAYNQQYAQQNQERLREYDRNRVRPVDQIERQRIYRKRWRTENAERIRLVNQAWYAQMKSDPARYEAWLRQASARMRQGRKLDPVRFRNYTKTRKARMKGAYGTHTLVQWLDRCAYYGWRCAYCTCELTPLTVQKEHVKAVKVGGCNLAANLVPACLSCNSSKGIKFWQPHLP
jgi:hypothetical protein